MTLSVDSVRIFDIPVTRASGSAVLGVIAERLERGERLRISYVNAHTLTLAARNPRLMTALQTSDLVLNDGIGVAIAARMRGTRFSENLNGSDFNARLLDLAATRRWSVFLLGARPGVSQAAANRASDERPALDIAGTEHGFTSAADDQLAAEVKAAHADVLMVGMGNPKQEIWLDHQFQRTDAKLGVAVGAFLDFTAGEVRRAPAWMNRLGIEWCYRLLQEPRRLTRRYLLGIPVFLTLAWRRRRSDMS